MGEVRVVNASPLIALAKVGRLDLLHARGQKLIVPRAVAEEILSGPVGDPARSALEADFGAPFETAPVDLDVLGWSLGAGESSVLSIARAAGALAILDDYEARTAARALGIRLTGTLGIVIQAAQDGKLKSAAQLLRKLRAVGLRLNDQVISSALVHCGETWEP